MDPTSTEALQAILCKDLAFQLLPSVKIEEKDETSDSVTASAPEFRSVACPLDLSLQLQSNPRMIFPDSLYGRNNEIKMLKDYCNRILMQENRSVELALIAAKSGMGKTTLAVTSLQHLDNIKFVKGKFQPRQVCPYAAFSEAMTEIIHEFTESLEPEGIVATRNRVKTALGEEASMVSALVPALADFLNEKSQLKVSRKSNVMGPDALIRFRTVFCTLMASVCSRQEPVILFLDDLQWAHTESLELLDSLLTDSSIKGLVIIGACRDNEVTIQDDLAVFLRRMEDTKGLCVTQIHLPELTEACVSAMVAELFGIPSKKCCGVGQYLFENCSGQPLHTLQLLRALQAHELIEVCDSNLILNKEKADKVLKKAGRDALQLVSRQIRQLPQRLQDWLCVAAFLGSSFDLKLITLATENPCAGCSKRAFELGLIQPSGLSDGDNNGFRFAHDVVQQASYELIEPDMREKMHFTIAMRLWKRLENPQLVEKYAVLIASHLKYGVSALTSEQETVECAELFLLAANNAKLVSAFQLAASFLDIARELLPGRTLWRDYYELSLALYACSAETEFVVGNSDKCEFLCKELISNGRSVEDAITAYTVMMMQLGCRNCFEEAIDLGLQCMNSLGEPIPRNPSLPTVLLTLRRTGRKLRNLSPGDILSLPRMRDPTSVAAMSILNDLFTRAFTHQKLRVVVSGKMIDLTLREGLSACSAVGFAFHAVVLCTSFQRPVEGYRYAQIALKLLEAFGFTEYTARVYTFVYGCVASIVRPVKECMGPLECAHRCGVVSGDTEFAMFALHMYNSLKLYQGTPVNLVFEEALKVRASMLEARQDMAALLHEAVVQAVAGIAGKIVSSAVINGVTMTRENMLNLRKKEKTPTFLVVLYGNWAVEHFWNGDYQASVKYFSLARSFGHAHVVMYFSCSLVFMEGMANFILASDSLKNCGLNWNRMRRGRQSLAFLRKHSRVIPANLLHQVQLLEAMQHYLQGNWEMSMRKFQLAKERANKMGMIAEEALVNELKGRSILGRSRNRRSDEGLSLIRQARDLFRTWGAVRRAERLDSFLLEPH